MSCSVAERKTNQEEVKRLESKFRVSRECIYNGIQTLLDTMLAVRNSQEVRRLRGVLVISQHTRWRSLAEKPGG
jgi:hypothetical protein